MLVLALDTTTRAGSVAVLRDDQPLSVIVGDVNRTHGERLPAEIERALAAAGVARRQLQLLVVASGPGAFTGLRIGLAAIQGLAMVLAVPAIGVSALDALADAARDLHRATGPIGAWIDAQRGEVFAASYPARHSAMDAGGQEPAVGAPGRVLDGLTDDELRDAVFIGDGAVRYREEILRHTRGAARVVDPPAALAPYLARIGWRRAERGEAGPPHALQPLYVRRSDAELERLRRTPV